MPPFWPVNLRSPCAANHKSYSQLHYFFFIRSITTKYQQPPGHPSSSLFMGRARRNQRDAIRKSRAKRRNRGKNTSDVSSEEDEGPRIQHVAKKARTVTAAKVDIDSKREEGEEPLLKVSSVEETGNITTAASSSTELQNNNTAPIKSEEHKETSKSEGEPKATTPKKPLDKIERMRLKKQQQKARRKEKKAAREAAALSK